MLKKIKNIFNQDNSNPASDNKLQADFKESLQKFEIDVKTKDDHSIIKSGNDLILKSQLFMLDAYFNDKKNRYALVAIEANRTSKVVVANSYYNLKKYDDALRLIKQILEQYPNDTEALALKKVINKEKTGS